MKAHSLVGGSFEQLLGSLSPADFSGTQPFECQGSEAPAPYLSGGSQSDFPEPTLLRKYKLSVPPAPTYGIRNSRGGAQQFVT